MRRAPILARRALAALLLGGTLGWSSLACAQSGELILTSAPSPVGAGARATAVGSAFIALADDATAASWNPAGLIQLERPEISLVGRGFVQRDRIGTISVTGDLVENSDGSFFQTERTTRGGTDSTTTVALNYLSAALPFSWRGRNMVLSLNYQEMLSFDRRLDFVVTSSTPGGVTESRALFDQRGHVDAFSPAVAIELSPDLSLGATLNYWFDGIGSDFAWRIHEDQTILGDGSLLATATTRTTASSFRGTNGTFGLLWKPAEGIGLGAVVKIPFDARFHFETELERVRATGRPGEFVDEMRSRSESQQMELPLSFGFGASWRVSDRLVLSSDVTQVQWSDFRINASGGQSFLVTGDPSSEASVSNVTTVRVGGEYLFLTSASIIALRGGAFYDPEPSRGAPEDVWGLSAGLGLTTARFSVDAAYRVRVGDNIGGTSVLTRQLAVPDGALDFVQHAFYLSAVVYF